MAAAEIQFRDLVGMDYSVWATHSNLLDYFLKISDLTYLVQIDRRGKEFWYIRNKDHPYGVSVAEVKDIPEQLRMVTLLEK